MALNLGVILRNAGIDPDETLVIRHAYAREHLDTGIAVIHADSTDEEILEYTRTQSPIPGRFPANPPRYWVVLVKEGGSSARLWRVVENQGELEPSAGNRIFNIAEIADLQQLHNRLVIHWNAPRSWWVKGLTGANYPVIEIADAEPIPFPGFDNLVLDYPNLQAVMREPRYASWRTALGAVSGIYLITDTATGKHYVGKADGAENISQRWTAYATNGHGGNVELKGMNPATFRYSVLRVFDPATPQPRIDQAESHYKLALDTRRHGLNRN